MAVNLSPRQVREADICERVSAILSDTGLDGNHLELEITEGAIMDRMDDTETKLRLLKGLGVRLAIDDFGTGYSSLAYLKRFAIDKLKIDKRFVHDIPDDRVQMEIVAAIISMAKSLRLEVLAEGVETDDQLEALKAGGCDTAQGYLFSPALPRNEITTFLQLYTTPSARRASAGTCLSSYRTAQRASEEPKRGH
jgi:EAL domain-containing protein (putative c-di-GMP-specific phosphodiesterase class I)